MHTYFPQRTALATVIITALFSAGARSELWLPADLASGDAAALSALNAAGGQVPGIYAVSVYLNGEDTGERDVRFTPADGTDEAERMAGGAVRDVTGLAPWLTRADMVAFGVDLKKHPALAAVPDDARVIPGDVIPGAFTAFDFARMRLDVSIPQAELSGRVKGEVPPERWDDGITALLLNYGVSGSERTGRYGDSSSQAVSLNSGLNVGPWRLRAGRRWQQENSDRRYVRTWQRNETYAMRTLVPLRSDLTVGESHTQGGIFDSVGFRGVSLSSDDAMVPDALRGFAPVVRGTALSAAEVTVRQNGYVVYQMPVPQGPFIIRDLRAAGTAGDLEVTVKEADGSRRVFTVPFSTIPVLTREGQMKYALTAGHLRSSSDRYRTPAFAEGTLRYGLPGGVTAWGGTQVSDRYRAVSAGAGMNMAHFGAASFDLIHATSELADGSRHQGQSARFLYSWFLGATETTFNLVGYRYSTRGFHTLDETALKGMRGWLYDYDNTDEDGRPVRRPYTDYYNLSSPRKGRIEASISQRAGSAGSLYLSGSRENYWQGRGATNAWQAGFSGAAGQVSYTLSGRYQKTDLQPADRSVSLTLSLPLDALLPGHTHYPDVRASFSASEDNRGSVTQQAGLSGSALEDHRLSWSANQGYSKSGKETGSASLGYRGDSGDASLGYGYSRNYHTVTYAYSGGAVLHAGGLTAGHTINDGAVLVAAPGAAGAQVSNSNGMHLDGHGYALVTAASPYRESHVALDVNTLPDDVDSDGADRKVVPTPGAIVRASFNTKPGLRALMTLTHNGRPVPFGATVAGDGISGIMGEGGEVYLSGLTPSGTLTAQWGQDAGTQCTVHYHVAADAEEPVAHITAECR